MKEVVEMYISVVELQNLQGVKNSAYDVLKSDFLYNSNKIEGSNFSKSESDKLVYESIVEGSHHINDVIEAFNSIQLFEYIITTLGNDLTKKSLLIFHMILKDRTLGYDLFLAGCWKKMQNQISNSDLCLAKPEEVETKINELLMEWNQSDKTFEDIIKFHVTFEHIHPYQDGSGRIGRFIILKQCIENNIDLAVIDGSLSKEYKAALYKAQTKNDYSDIKHIFELSQQKADKRMPFVQETLNCIRNSNSTITNTMLSH